MWTRRMQQSCKRLKWYSSTTHTMSYTIGVQHTFRTLLRLLSLTLPGAGSDHLYHQVCCHSQDEDKAWRRTCLLFPSPGQPSETVYHLNFNSSIADVHFADG